MDILNPLQIQFSWLQWFIQQNTCSTRISFTRDIILKINLWMKISWKRFHVQLTKDFLFEKGIKK